jgi:CheY-like chemotaxis protein
MTKILLVDDSKFLRLATERALAHAGYDMSSATDGEQALEMARKEHPDLILLDMLLPKLPGPEVLKALKKDANTADIPVVVFTGLSNKNAARLEHDGAFGYLEKTGLGLDKGCEALIAAVADIVQHLPRKPDPPTGSTKDAKPVAVPREITKDKTKGKSKAQRAGVRP